MSDLHEQESEFSRLLRRAPFDEAPSSEHCNVLREQALAAFDRAASAPAATVWWKHALNNGRELMRRPIPRLIAFSIACAIIATVWTLIPGQQSTALAFNKLAETVITAKTAKFEMEVNVEGQPKLKAQTYFLAPGRYRQELAGSSINITDLKARKIVHLMPSEKKAFVMNIKGEPEKGKSHDYFEQVRELLSKNRDAKDDEYERLGEKEIDGKRATGFRLDSPAQTVTLWGDPKTGQPVRIESTFSGLPRTDTTMTNFVFNVPLDESLFDLKPPADYKVQSLDVDASKPDEAALVEAFKISVEIGGPEFPESLDMMGVQRIVIKYAVGLGKVPPEEEIQRMMKLSIAMGRGFGFALTLPESADAHYAGKGIKRDEKDRPIFWYKPEGAKKYRVIYADLLAKEAIEAPQVEGAKRLEKASKSTKPSGK